MFLYHNWLSLSLATRIKIAEQFRIEQKTGREVFDDIVKNDGYLIKDIEEKLNLDSIQKYLGTEVTDFAELWTMLVDKIEGRFPIVEVTAIEVKSGQVIPGEVLIIQKPWCDTCDSKGVRHKKVCPKYVAI